MIISIHEGSTCDRFGPEKGYAMLKRAGIDGLQLSFFDFKPDLEFFGDRILPLMKQAGLRF